MSTAGQQIFRTRPHGIMFHHFHDGKKHPPSQGSITGMQFDQMLTYLKQEYKLLSAGEWYNLARAGALEPGQVCITFDDNLLCQYEIAVPILAQHNLTAFFFVYTSPLTGVAERLEIYRHFRSTRYTEMNKFYSEFYQVLDTTPHQSIVERELSGYDPEVYLAQFPFYSEPDRRFRFVRDRILGTERYFEVMDAMIKTADYDIDAISGDLWNSPHELKAMQAAGHIIGLHSHTHPTRLNALDFAAQQSEYLRNHTFLTDLLGGPIRTASHPCNSYNEGTMQIFRELGIDVAFRANMEPGFRSQYEFPRFDHALLLKEIETVNL